MKHLFRIFSAIPILVFKIWLIGYVGSALIFIWHFDRKRSKEWLNYMRKPFWSKDSTYNKDFESKLTGKKQVLTHNCIRVYHTFIDFVLNRYEVVSPEDYVKLYMQNEK